MNSPPPHPPPPARSPSAPTPSKPATRPATVSSPAISGAPTSPARGRSSSTLTTAAATVAPPPISPRTSRVGYLVAALDHSDVVAPEIADNVQGFIANRVPDARFLLDYMLAGAIPCTARPDPDRIAIVGHSAGGWTALALPETDTRIQAVVALAPGGASNPKPGIIPATLSFNWPRPPATLYIVAEDDALTPIAGMHELYSRTPGPKQMVVL